MHNVINHAEKYVDGHIRSDGIENFWSLLKRGLEGAYISVDPFHLFRYLDEKFFRFNHRKLTDGERFSIVASSCARASADLFRAYRQGFKRRLKNALPKAFTRDAEKTASKKGCNKEVRTKSMT